MKNTQILIKRTYLGNVTTKKYECDTAYIETNKHDSNTDFVHLVISKSQKDNREKVYLRVNDNDLKQQLKANHYEIYVDDKLLIEFDGKYDYTSRLDY